MILEKGEIMPIEIIKKYCTFKAETCYMLVLLARKKENATQVESDKNKKAHRKTFTTLDEAEDILSEFERIAALNPTVQYRIYISVNRRSLIKGLCEFNKKISDIQFALINGNREALTTIHRLGSEWKSVLCSKECRDEKNFLFDVDFVNNTVDGNQKALDFKEQLEKQTTVLYFGKSKNGFAIVTTPFDVRMVKMPKEVELKNDAYLYIGGFNYKNSLI